MKVICPSCRKAVEGEKVLFCPYCGNRLETGKMVPSEVRSWLDRIGAAQTYPERAKILKQARMQFPDDPDLEWEALFIGEEKAKDRRSWKQTGLEIIKSHLLEIYRTPELFSASKREEMRQELFASPELLACLQRQEDSEKGMKDYLFRLSKEHIAIFLEGDNRLMGNLFGFRTEKRKEKLLAAPTAQILLRIREDQALTADERSLLEACYRQAFSDLMDGKTEFLEAELMRYGK